MNDVHLNILDLSKTLPEPGDVCNLHLFETMVNKAHSFIEESGDTLEAILVPGDFNDHSLPAYNLTEPNDKWGQMKETFTTITGTLAEKFPGVPVLSAVGNNDCYYHDEAPKVNTETGVVNSTQYY